MSPVVLLFTRDEITTMCIPAIPALIALTVASGVAQYQEKKQSSAYLRNQLGLEGEENAKATQDQIDQIQNQASIDMSERTKAALQERARLRVAAGEFGVGGVSPDIAEKRSLFSEGYDLATIDNNRTAAQRQAVREGRSSQARTLTGIYQNRAPDALASALTIGANVAGIAATQPSAPDLPGTKDKYGLPINGVGRNGRPIN